MSERFSTTAILMGQPTRLGNVCNFVENLDGPTYMKINSQNFIEGYFHIVYPYQGLVPTNFQTRLQVKVKCFPSTVPLNSIPLVDVNKTFPFPPSSAFTPVNTVGIFVLSVILTVLEDCSVITVVVCVVSVE